VSPRTLATAALLLAAAAPAAVAAPESPRLSVELGPDVVALDEPVVLVFEVSAAGFGSPQLEPRFRLENLEVVSGPSTSRTSSWVNGQSSASTRLVWRLRPLAVGPAAARDLSAAVGAELLAVPDRVIEIVAQAPPGRRAPGSPAPIDPFEAFLGEDPFGPFRRRDRPVAPAARPKLALRAEVDRPVAWVGEQVGWRLTLDTQAEVSAFRPRPLPDFRGFWVREIPQPERLRPEWIEVGGDRFARVPMLGRALFPLRPGRHRLEAVTADLVIRLAEVGWFGPFGRDEQISLTTEPVEIEVRALPPAPDGFGGAVGPLDVAGSIDPRRVETGQATTLELVVAGDGHLQGLEPPAIAVPPGLRRFDPQVETSDEVVGGRIRSQRRWRWVIVADRPGQVRIDPIALTWFDPVTESYRTSATAPLELEVVPASSPPAALAPERAGEPGESRGEDRGGPVPIGLAAAAGLAAAILAAAGALARRRSPRRGLRRRLESAHLAARAEPSPRDAAVRLEEAWRELVRERWGISPGVPVAHWPERIVAGGGTEAAARALVELFDELHGLRYAPELSDVEALRIEAVERSRRLARDLA
jgi:hypothetical protein